MPTSSRMLREMEADDLLWQSRKRSAKRRRKYISKYKKVNTSATKGSLFSFSFQCIFRRQNEEACLHKGFVKGQKKCTTCFTETKNRESCVKLSNRFFCLCCFKKNLVFKVQHSKWSKFFNSFFYSDKHAICCAWKVIFPPFPVKAKIMRRFELQL